MPISMSVPTVCRGKIGPETIFKGDTDAAVTLASVWMGVKEFKGAASESTPQPSIPGKGKPIFQNTEWRFLQTIQVFGTAQVVLLHCKTYWIPPLDIMFYIWDREAAFTRVGEWAVSC